MIQRILFIANLFNLFFAAWCVYRAAAQGASFITLVVVGLVALIVVQCVLVALQFGLSAIANKGLAGMSISGVLRAYVGELCNSLSLFGFRMAVGVDAAKDDIDNAISKRGVLLVHGYFCNRGLWHDEMQRLRARGVPHIAITLEPAFGSISSYADAVHDAVEKLHAHTGMAPVCVGHSMGGLAARAYAAKYGADRVQRFITLGTPHHGTLHALAGYGINAKEMRLNSAWLASNAAQLNEATRAKFLCIHSNGDNIVAPYKSATLEGAENRFVPSSGHLHLAFTTEFHTALDDDLSH